MADARGERVSLVEASSDLFPDRAEAVIVVAGIAHRQKITVLGIQHEEQAVEQCQRRVFQLLKILPRTRRRSFGVSRVKSRDQIREETAEHEIGEIPRDPLLPTAALVQREKMKGALILASLDEGGAAEHEREHAKAMGARVLVPFG
jgi:hypothetical protein